MLETIGRFLGNVAPYAAVLLGLVTLYFLWVAAREWQAAQRAAFGIERDIATSEMIGALGRAAVVIFAGLVVLGLGRLGERVGESDKAAAEPTRPIVTTAPGVRTPTPGAGEVAAPSDATATTQPEVTGVPGLPSEPTQPAAVTPTPQTARVTAFGGVWLRDAPNGGTIQVLPEETTVQFLEGRQFAGNFDWQKVRVLTAPVGSEALVGLEGWVAAEFVTSGP